MIIKMLGIGSAALTGKDTLFKVLDYLIPNKFERIGLADLLKSECDEFCRKNYGISAFTKIPREKEIIRPFFVTHGKVKRNLSNGTYWTGLVQERVNKIKEEGLIPVCTDIRYNLYLNDEYYWLKEVNEGVYIHVNRFLDGNKIPPANEEEKENTVKLEKLADYRLNWETSNDFNYLCDVVSLQLKDLIQKIIND